ncbi:MAG TPA: nitroreductase family protein [Anaerolineaceae bacterium]|nr:nitroreductase family protein [Anaerolineaceae bacterium]HOA21872.1 nitroreductase family protein [Anaerolineaceae bacterium]
MQRDLDKADWAVGLMQSRQSVRNFKEEPVPEEILYEVLAAGINSATGGNLQPYSIIVEKNRLKNQQLAQLCGGQSFIAQAPVNLIFLLDWHKLAVYSRKNNAPFTCNKSYRHFMIAMDDVVCAAQSVETAAWLYGIGGCYVGTILECIPAIAELYKLPMLAAPVLLLSLGYPKTLAVPRKKLDQDMVVFRGAYPTLSAEKISEAYDRKYSGMRFSLPADPHKRQALLDEFRAALCTTYNENKCDEIIRAAEKAGSLSEIQRRFGLHYHAAEMLSSDVIEGLASQGIYPYYGLLEQDPEP